MPLLIAAGVTAAAGLGATAYGASQAGKVTKYDQNKIRADLQPWQDKITQQSGRAEDLYAQSAAQRGRATAMYDRADQMFDPRSDYYNQQRQMMSQQIASQSANVVQQQNQLMAQRGMGGGGISGLLGAVSANQAGEQTRQGMLGMQQQGIGLGTSMAQAGTGMMSAAGQLSGQSATLMGQATQQQGAHSENIAQAYLSNVDAQNAAQQAKAAAWMGAGQGLLGASGTMAGAYKPGG
jgi:hypothetical protein